MTKHLLSVSIYTHSYIVYKKQWNETMFVSGFAVATKMKKKKPNSYNILLHSLEQIFVRAQTASYTFDLLYILCCKRYKYV